MWPVGGVGIHLRSERSREYISIPLSLSNKGWHMRWFYLHDVGQGPFPGPQLLGIDRSIPSEAPPTGVMMLHLRRKLESKAIWCGCASYEREASQVRMSLDPTSGEGWLLSRLDMCPWIRLGRIFCPPATRVLPSDLDIARWVSHTLEVWKGA